MFTLHASYPESTDIDDGTLAGLTRQAFGVMKENTDYQSMAKVPATMAALKWKTRYSLPVRYGDIGLRRSSTTG